LLAKKPPAGFPTVLEFRRIDLFKGVKEPGIMRMQLASAGKRLVENNLPRGITLE
jgi:hypothetical protein